MTESSLYKEAAAKLGWMFEPAFGGYINEGEQRPIEPGMSRFAAYKVADDAEDACWISGLEDLAAVGAYLDREAV